MKKIIVTIAIATLSFLIVLTAACGSGSNPSAENPFTSKVIKSGPIGNLTVTLTNDAGKLKNGDQEFRVSFTDTAGKVVEVGAASVNFQMPAMGSMSAMNEGATLTTTGTPGVYNAKVKLPMVGDWQAQIMFEGSAGNGKTSLPISVQ